MLDAQNYPDTIIDFILSFLYLSIVIWVQNPALVRFRSKISNRNLQPCCSIIPSMNN